MDLGYGGSWFEVVRVRYGEYLFEFKLVVTRLSRDSIFFLFGFRYVCSWLFWDFLVI